MVSSFAETKADCTLDDESHVFSTDFNGYIQHPFQFLSDQEEDKDILLIYSSAHSFFELLFQEVCENQSFEFACIKCLDSEIVLGNNHLVL